jgi:hypothetical protein
MNAFSLLAVNINNLSMAMQTLFSGSSSFWDTTHNSEICLGSLIWLTEHHSIKLFAYSALRLSFRNLYFSFIIGSEDF